MIARLCGVSSGAGFRRVDDVDHLSRRDVVQPVAVTIVEGVEHFPVKSFHSRTEQHLGVRFHRPMRVNLDEDPLRSARDRDAT